MHNTSTGAATTLSVLSQQRHPRKRLAARRARILLNIRMRLQVRSQIRPIRKRPIAISARERLLPRMRPDVSLKQPRSRERLPAHGALARQSVRPNVHLQRPQGHVHLLAILAAELFGGTAASGAMELPVLGQSGKCRVAFPAIRTLVSHAVLVVGSPFLGEVFGSAG